MPKSGSEQIEAVAGEDVVQGKVSCTSDGRMREGWFRASSAITEISDKDYRSFCWPCYALEEISDGKPVE